MQTFDITGEASYTFSLEVRAETLEDAIKIAENSVSFSIKGSIRADGIIDYDMPYVMDGIEYSETGPDKDVDI